MQYVNFQESDLIQLIENKYDNHTTEDGLILSYVEGWNLETDATSVEMGVWKAFVFEVVGATNQAYQVYYVIGNSYYMSEVGEWYDYFPNEDYHHRDWILTNGDDTIRCIKVKQVPVTTYEWQPE